jgi:hypothetical protein
MTNREFARLFIALTAGPVSPTKLGSRNARVHQALKSRGESRAVFLADYLKNLARRGASQAEVARTANKLMEAFPEYAVHVARALAAATAKRPVSTEGVTP